MAITVHRINSGARESLQRLLNAFWLRKAFIAEKSMYMNIGYWKDNPRTLDQACLAFIKLVGETAQLNENDNLLDVACGYGDQDIDWVEEFNVKHIAAVNLSRHQLKVADQRVIERNLQDRISFHWCSAVQLPFEDGTFDKVTSVEAAFQFNTRETFFREARRVLKHGGRLVVTDLLPKESRQKTRYSPKANHYTAGVYCKKLEDAGFEQVSMTNITDAAAAPFHDYLKRRVYEDEFQARVNPLFFRYLKWWLPRARVWNDMDVVIFTGLRA